jgi:hypothetical protein
MILDNHRVEKSPKLSTEITCQPDTQPSYMAHHGHPVMRCLKASSKYLLARDHLFYWIIRNPPSDIKGQLVIADGIIQHIIPFSDGWLYFFVLTIGTVPYLPAIIDGKIEALGIVRAVGISLS